jgi:hypothetical protein
MRIVALAPQVLWALALILPILIGVAGRACWPQA